MCLVPCGCFDPSTPADTDSGSGCTDIAVLNTSGFVSTILGRDRFSFIDQHVFTFEAGAAFPYAMDSGDVDGDGIAGILIVLAGGTCKARS